jgi:hypothetical protein
MHGERGMWAIIERKGYERNARANVVDNVGGATFEGREEPKRFGPKTEEAEEHDGSAQDN